MHLLLFRDLLLPEVECVLMLLNVVLEFKELALLLLQLCDFLLLLLLDGHVVFLQAGQVGICIKLLEISLTYLDTYHFEFLFAFLLPVEQHTRLFSLSFVFLHWLSFSNEFREGG